MVSDSLRQVTMPQVLGLWIIMAFAIAIGMLILLLCYLFQKTRFADQFFGLFLGTGLPPEQND